MKTTQARHPIARKEPYITEIHGDTRTDDYFWMRHRDSEEILEYLNAENAFAEEELKDVAELRGQLFKEIKGRIKEKDMSVPYQWQGFEYFSEFEEGEEYARHSRVKKGEKARLILDENVRAEGKPFYALSSKVVSPDNGKLAVGEDTVGRRLYTLSFLPLTSEETMDDSVEGTDGNAVWTADSNGVFYVKKDPQTLRPYQVWLHRLGTNQSEDELIYEEGDDTFHMGIGLSKSKLFLFIHCQSTITSEVLYAPLNEPGSDPKSVVPRTKGLEYKADHLDGHFYVLHNLMAKNFKLSILPESGGSRLEDAEVLIPHSNDIYLEEFELLHGLVALEERAAGRTRIRLVSNRNYEKSKCINFDEEVYTVFLHHNPEPDLKALRIGYVSMTIPNSVYDYHLEDGRLELLKQVEVVGDYRPGDYQSERMDVTARDGEKVPVSLVYRKDFKKDGNGPLLLYGYGSYGISVDPFFSHARLSLLDRGFAFAIAHIRGGQEKGRKWYEAGRLKQKMNTFFDFIDVAEHLIDRNYTSRNHLYAMGGSAGGLLMGAVMNLRPDLWHGLVAQVPFVDVVNTMLDASIPLTTGEYDEWGNPNDEGFYHYILGYSPYDNVEKKDYPALLITSGYHDSQVQYWEPTKWAARLRELKTDKNPLLLVTEMEAGHGGASGRFKRLKEVALEYAFLLKLEGITS